MKEIKYVYTDKVQEVVVNAKDLGLFNFVFNCRSIYLPQFLCVIMKISIYCIWIGSHPPFQYLFVFFSYELAFAYFGINKKSSSETSPFAKDLFSFEKQNVVFLKQESKCVYW